MAGLDGDPDLALCLEPADARTVAGARVMGCDRRVSQRIPFHLDFPEAMAEPVVRSV
jgi:hypothetical protein